MAFRNAAFNILYPLKLLSPMSWVRMAKGLVTDGWRQELYVTTSDNGHAKKQRLDAAYVARSREACIKEKLIDGDPQSTLIVAAEAAALSISRAFMQNNFQEITDRTRLEPEQAAALADRLISELPVQFPELLSGDASGKVLLLVIGRVMNRFAGDGAVKMTESRLSARNVARRSGTFLTTDAFAQDTLGALMALSMASNTLAGLSEGLTLSVGDRENVMHTLRALAFQAGDSSAEKSIRSFLDFYTRYGIRGTMYAETIRRYLGQKLEDIRRANVEIQTAHALAQKLKADAKLDTAQGREAAKQALALQFAASTQAQEALKKLTFKDWLEVGAKAVLETESTMAATRLTGRIAGAVVQVGALEAARGDDFDAMASLQAVAYGMDVHTAAQLQLSAEQGGQDLSGQQVIELAQFVHDPAQQLEVRLELLEHMEGSVTDRIAAALGRDQAFNEAVAAVEQARFVEGLQLLQFAPLLQMEGKPLHEVAARIAELRSYRAHSAQKQLDQQAVDAPASLSPAGKTEQSALSEMDIEDQTVAAAERDMSAAGSEVVAPDDLFIINPDGSCTIRVDINLNHFIQTYLADNPDNTITTSALATSYIDWLAADAYTDTDNDLVDRSPMRAALERMGFDLANTAHQEQLVTLFSDIFTANFDADGNGRISGTDLTAFDANETVVAADPTGQLDRVASDNIATVVFNIDITEFHLALLDALQTEDSPRSALQGAVPQGETISSYLAV
ncbi:MAG TPA: hypothetical protein PKL83_06950, partial [bacterium]|nr:hypothetical protein [bacterium]